MEHGMNSCPSYYKITVLLGYRDFCVHILNKISIRTKIKEIQDLNMHSRSTKIHTNQNRKINPEEMFFRSMTKNPIIASSKRTLFSRTKLKHRSSCQTCPLSNSLQITSIDISYIISYMYGSVTNPSVHFSNKQLLLCN